MLFDVRTCSAPLDVLWEAKTVVAMGKEVG
jgi:hypothetical protein